MSSIKLESQTLSIEADNLYEMLYDGEGNQRVNSDKVILKELNLLDSPPLVVQTDQNAQIANLRLNKQFKAVNLLPGFVSVPATSHLFDLVSGSIIYPNLDAEAAQY